MSVRVIYVDCSPASRVILDETAITNKTETISLEFIQDLYEIKIITILTLEH